MPVMDEFKEERAALKNGTLKEKLAYFYEYYKWHAVAAVFAVAAESSLLYHFITQKDTAFYLALINASDTVSSELPDHNFAAYAGIDTGDCQIVYDTSMLINFESAMNRDHHASVEKFMLLLTAAEMDAVVADPGGFPEYIRKTAKWYFLAMVFRNLNKLP